MASNEIKYTQSVWGYQEVKRKFWLEGKNRVLSLYLRLFCKIGHGCSDEKRRISELSVAQQLIRLRFMLLSPMGTGKFHRRRKCINHGCIISQASADFKWSPKGSKDTGGRGRYATPTSSPAAARLVVLQKQQLQWVPLSRNNSFNLTYGAPTLCQGFPGAAGRKGTLYSWGSAPWFSL